MAIVTKIIMTAVLTPMVMAMFTAVVKALIIAIPGHGNRDPYDSGGGGVVGPVRSHHSVGAPPGLRSTEGTMELFSCSSLPSYQDTGSATFIVMYRTI